MWDAIFNDLRGLRRTLLTLAVLFFTIMLLEVDLGHRPALAARESWLALVPVVWLPIGLLALMALQIKPNRTIALATQAVMAVAAAVGMVGSGLHMVAAGVDIEHLSRVFSSAVWGGPVSPNWPVAITLAAVLGFIAAFAAERDGHASSRDAPAFVTACANILIVAGIVCAVPPALVMISATLLICAALLLLAALIAMLANAALDRSAS